MPLHEGHRNRVDCSSCVHLFPCAEGYPVWGMFDRHWICPRDLPTFVPEQERHMLFQFVQYVSHLDQGQIQLLRDELWRQWFPDPRKLAYAKVTHLVMFLRHEIKLGIYAHLLLPYRARNGKHGTPQS
jgi:hypothetical protein